MLLSDVYLTSVCLSVDTSGITREHRGLRKTEIGTEVAHVTRQTKASLSAPPIKGGA